MTTRKKMGAAAFLAIALSLSGCAAGKPYAWLHPESHNCRAITLPGGWRLPNDPARAPGYFADDPAARLVYRLDSSSGNILVGLVLPAGNVQAAEECSRHFAISLGTTKVVEITADRWNRGRRPLNPGGIWNSNTTTYGEIDPLVQRIVASASAERPFAGSIGPERRQLSPDRRFIVLSTIDGGAASKGNDYDLPSKILVDVHGVASGKRAASLRGEFFKTDPSRLLQGGTWISDRHLILPALMDNSELILCDLNRESPAADPVMPVVEQPTLFAFEIGTDESWAQANGAFPHLNAFTLVPEGASWSFQWRATNPVGKSAVMLTSDNGRGGFRWFDSPIPGNELRDGPYQIDAFAFLEAHSGRRVAATATGFVTPTYRYPRPDYSDTPDRFEYRHASRIPQEKTKMWGTVEFGESVKEGAATVYTIDCLTKELPAPTMGFAAKWDLHGSKVDVEPDVGPCVKGATKLYFTPPPNAPPGEYEIGIEALAGNTSWGTSQSFVVDESAKVAEAKPRQMAPIPVASPVTTPILLAVVPYWGHGMKQRFSFIAVSAEAGAEIAAIEVRFAFASKAGESCSFRFDRAGSHVALKDEAGQPASVVENSNCRVAAPEMHVEGDSLTVSADVEFKAAFAGPRGVFVQAVDQRGQSSRLELLGGWEIR